MSISASRAQKQSEGCTQSQHLTPNSLDNIISKQKEWMASASKRLGINNPKGRKSAPSESSSKRPSLSPYTTLRRPGVRSLNSRYRSSSQSQVPSQIPIKRPTTRPSPEGYAFTRRRGPSDKPLPSLPVATITSKSPVNRRSLIDATERPLRRSVSSEFTQVETEEWPSLSPERPRSSAYMGHEPAPVKPSIGESVIEGMRQLNLDDDTHPSIPAPKACIVEPQINRQPIIDPILQARCSSSSSRNSSELSSTKTGSSQPLDARARAVPGLHQKVKPTVRQTKTSAMRLRLSGGSVDGADVKSEHIGQSHADQRKGMSGKSSTPRTISDNGPAPGPIRLSSQSRHAATPRGSPYLIPSRSNVKPIDIKRKPVSAPDGNCSSGDPRSGSTDSTEEFRQSQVVAVKRVKGSGPGKRQASILLPSRLIRRFPDEESEGEIPTCRLWKPSGERDNVELDSQDADIDTDPDSMPSTSGDKANDDHKTESKKQQSNLLSFSEVMSTPPPAADESNYSSDSSEGSIRGYDEDGGFKIKKLGGHGKDGATLRISDSARRLLSPNHEPEELEESEVGNKRNSITDLRQAVVLKEHLRRSGGLIKSQIQVTRSITERSLARLSGFSSHDGDAGSVSVYSVLEHAGIDEEPRSTRTELPAEPLADAASVSTPIRIEREETQVSKAACTPSSTGQGDWPLKDFKSLADTTKPTPGVSEASLSPWIPPADWDATMGQADTSIVSEDVGTPYPPVPPNTPAADVETESKQAQVSDYLTNAQHRVPTPTPNQLPMNITRVPCTDPIKRQYPPRTTSKQSVPQQPSNHVTNSLSPVRESPERVTGLRQAKKQYGKDLGQLPELKHMRTFSESIEDINQNLESVRLTSAAPKAAVPTASGKKAMSTLRGLFHKKSFEFRSSSRRGRMQGVDTSLQSSPLLATPTPYQRSSRMKGLAQLQSDAMTPARSKSLLQRKPTSAAKALDSASALESSSLETPEIRLATQTALKLLDLAREERPGARQNQLVELGKAMIRVVNAARDAEKALEQVKQAAAKAEIQALTSKKAVADVASMVETLLSDSE